MRQNLIKETALFAMMQATIIMTGVICAGADEKGFLIGKQAEPHLLSILANYGLIALTIPLAWIAFVFISRRSISVSMKLMTFYSGLVLVVVTTFFICFILGYSCSILDPFYNLNLLTT